jgi:CRP-like cAMP-binding protein
LCPANAVPERIIDLLLQATMLCPSILTSPAPSVSLIRLGSKVNAYGITFFVLDTKSLSGTKSLLLRQARQQLRHVGFLLRPDGVETRALDESSRAVSFPIHQLLRELVLFECLDSDQVDGLAKHLELRVLEPGDVLFAEGAADATLYIVASGVLEITRRTELETIHKIGRIGAGEYLGEIGLFTGAPHAATAKALTHCQIYQLSRDAVAPLLAANAKLTSAFDKSVRRGLAILHRDVAVRATEDIGGPGQLLLRIRSFFHFQPA